MSERIVGDARDLVTYPPGSEPEPYVPPWKREPRKAAD
jgi:hypothetical protein